jgi:hypothetical protein
MQSGWPRDRPRHLAKFEPARLANFVRQGDLGPAAMSLMLLMRSFCPELGEEMVSGNSLIVF